MSTVEKLTKKDPIAGEATQKNIDAWAARACRNSLQHSTNRKTNSKPALPATVARNPTVERTFDQCKYGKG